MKVGPTYIFDLRTQVPISGSRGSRTKTNALYSNTQLPLLTGENVLVSQDLFHGPVETTVLTAPRIGDEVSGDAFRAQLIFMGTGEPGNYGYNSAQGDRNVRFGGSRKRDSHAHFVFIFTPSNAHHRTEILAVDAGGHTVPLRHRSSSHGKAAMEIEMPLADIRELRFQYRTGAKRLLIEAPLFAVPPENREVDDLFDARIPLVVIRNEQHWRSVAADLAQLRLWSSAFQEHIPEDRFPLVFENITVRDLLAEYHKLRPKVGIHVDQKEMKLVFDDGSESRVWKDLKAWFRRATRHWIP